MKKGVLISIVSLVTFCVLSYGQGVKVLAPLTVNGPGDTYATHFDSLGSGGFMSVYSISSRNNIPGLRRKRGMMVYVVSVDTLYQLIGGTGNANWRAYLCNNVGAVLTWQGSLVIAPVSPQLNWAYYNLTDKKSYLFDGTIWQILSQDGPPGANGTNGTNGISIQWKGSLTTAPFAPQLNWAYYNSVDKRSYIYDGTVWMMLSQDGAAGSNGINGNDGISITWRGSLATAPSFPQLNWAYYDIVDKKSYLYDGSGWVILAQDGTNGSNGISIRWKGALDSIPANPQINWAYYNTLDRKSYLYADSVWSVMTKDGISISWQGSLDSDPLDPQINWAYYNYVNRAAYIFDGITWNVLVNDGQDGKGVNWIGNFSNANLPSSPSLNDAGYNTDAGQSQIWDGSQWKTVAKDGQNSTLKTQDNQVMDFMQIYVNVDSAVIVASGSFDTTVLVNLPPGVTMLFGTVTVSPDKDLPDGITIAWARIVGGIYSNTAGDNPFFGGIGTRKVKFRLTNFTTGDIVIPPTRFFLSIIYKKIINILE